MSEILKESTITVMGCLKGADGNLKQLAKENEFLQVPLFLPRSMLDVAITLLGKGYSIHEKVAPLLEKYGSLEDVPSKS